MDESSEAMYFVNEEHNEQMNIIIGPCKEGGRQFFHNDNEDNNK